MTDQELTDIAWSAFKVAMKDRRLGRFSFLLPSYHEGEPMHRMRRVEKTISDKLGEDWLNHGAAKDAAFRILREVTDLLPPCALVIATQLVAMGLEAQRELLHAGHDMHVAAVELGLLTVEDLITVVVQNPERVCFWHQKFSDNGEAEGEPEIQFFDQEHFDGRLKMFGAPPSPDVFHGHKKGGQ